MLPFCGFSLLILVEMMLVDHPHPVFILQITNLLAAGFSLAVASIFLVLHVIFSIIPYTTNTAARSFHMLLFVLSGCA